jgi:exodeoxyribonuclease VII large subunit
MSTVQRTSEQLELFEPQPLTVSEVTLQIKEVLADVFAAVSIVGEVSNLKYHTSGHVYFTLKDAGAQLKCALWSSKARRIKFQIENGQQLIVTGKIDVYPQRGEYQLIAEAITPKGMGGLELAFRQLYEKLQTRGWFAPERKQRLPRFPSRVGIVTSRSGAALQDILLILKSRWPLCDVWVIPVPVQGEGAAEAMAGTIAYLNQLFERPDVLIVGRGGGSLEDLWAFNEEVLAAAIVASRIPIISAIGHETDTTIADLVADARAPTPSAAATLVVPHLQELQRQLDGREVLLRQMIVGEWQSSTGRLHRIHQHRFFARPLEPIIERRRELATVASRLRATTVYRTQSAQRALAEKVVVLGALNPLNVLARGYSLTRHPMTKEPLVRTDQVAAGEVIETILHQGQIRSRVE